MKKETRVCIVCAMSALAMLALVFLLGGKKANAQEVPINAETFPSDWLRNLMLTPGYDLDGNGVLSDEEIQRITFIRYAFPLDAGRSKEIKTDGLINLPYCTELTLANLICSKLDVTFYNELPSTVRFWDCQIDRLQVVGQNVQTLEYNSIGMQEGGDEYDGQGLDNEYSWPYMPASTTAITGYVKRLETNGCPNLIRLVARGDSAHALRSLDVSESTKLEYLDCTNGKLEELNLKNNKKLKYLKCNGNDLRRLDLSRQRELRELDCANCDLAKLYINGSPKLRHLNCSGNRLKSLNLRKSVNLRYLYCRENRLNSLDLRKNKKLEGLECGRNSIRKLNLSMQKKLWRLECEDCAMEKLVVSNCRKLEYLYCFRNRLKSLNLRKTIKLKQLQCYENRLTSLNLQDNKKLSQLLCYDNNLKSLDLRKNDKLYWLNCQDNQICTLRLPNALTAHGTNWFSDVYYSEDEDAHIKMSSFACNPIHTLDITSFKKFNEDYFSIEDVSDFLSGFYYKKEVEVYNDEQGWTREFRGKPHPIKKLIVNKKLRRKDMKEVREQAKLYKVKLVYQ